jgi:hypothetical protein
LGFLLALAGVTVVHRSLCRGAFRLPLTITVMAVILSAMSVPASRFMTRIEQERRYRQPSPNHPAAGKAGMARQLAIGQHCPGLPEPGRWATEPVQSP